MTKTTYGFNGAGKLVPILPEVKIGNERLNRNHTSRLSGRQIVCEEHGTHPTCYVNKNNILVKCCRLCIKAYCQLTKARAADNWDGGTTKMDHPNRPGF
jgi:hypothetical protein